MNNKLFILFIILVSNISIGRAQKSLADSIVSLKEVEITKVRTDDNNIGAYTSRLNATIIESNITQSIGTLLSENSLIYIKSMGQGGRATSSFRGTSSNHTQVNWNGININPINNGSFDFSQYPAFFVDEVSLYHGSNYLKNGTGALGGSINLNNSNNQSIWLNKGIKNRILAEIGANQTYTAGVSSGYTTDRIYSNTRLYYQESENNFKYENKDQTTSSFKLRRKNADYNQWGLMQEFQYKLSETDKISANVWYMDNDNNLPQAIFEDNSQGNLSPYLEKQRAKNLRSLIKYNGGKNKSSYSFTTAYLFNNSNYRRWERDGYNDNRNNNKSHSIIAKGDYNYLFNQDISFGASLSYRYDLLHLSQYDRASSANNIRSSAHRNTATLQANLLWQINSPLAFSMQIMGEQNEDKFMPTFSAGINYEMIKNRLFLQSSAAYNYHYPTLNDLYWKPGGNPDLKPEKGFSYDATIRFMSDIDQKIQFNASLGYYVMTIDDWIIWLPKGSFILSPENIERVLSHGAEITTETSMHTGILWHRLLLNYAYSPSENSDNKQLPYVPIHKWNGRYILKVKNASFGYGMSYTSKRYTTTDESRSTNGFLIHDLELGYNFKFSKKTDLQLTLRIDNLLDEYYESTEYYPLSLRSWYVSARFSF